LAVTRSHRRHVHSSSATSEPGRVPPRSPRSRLTASPWRVLDPHPHGDWTRSRHSSSESRAAASSSIAGSPQLSVRIVPNYASHDNRDRDRLWHPAVRALADASWGSRTIRLTTCWHDRRRKGQPGARPPFPRTPTRRGMPAHRPRDPLLVRLPAV
jgi:hypothetical protein